MHNDLVEALKSEPEEDVDVQIFDQNLSRVFSTRQDSSLPPPVLSDDGEIRVNSTTKNHWRILELRWDHTEHTVANLISLCRPTIATPQSGAVFLVGCKSNFENWYRMIRLDGHLILSGRGSALHTEECFSNSQDDFAVRVIRSTSYISVDHGFGKKVLTEQEVSIYRSSDGKRLFLTANPGVSLARQSFAISPAGDQLAVLSDSTISLYQIAKPNPVTSISK